MAKRTCPRCGVVPRASDGYFHRGFGALSRIDRKTYICADCGMDEAMDDYRGLKLIPKHFWPIDPDRRT